MHPELFSFGAFTLHTYGLMIVIGAVSGFFYLSYVSKKELGIDREKIQTLAILIVVAAFVGGKLFLYLEDPSYYLSSWENITSNLRTGFVFYGSLLFAIPTIIWFFKKEKWPLWPMMDRIAITACIIHGTGRIGCFFAGCCHGIPTDMPWGITFSNPLSQALPLYTPLHPTQLYAAGLIFGIMIILLMLKRHNRFEGRIFFIYVILYAFGRGIIEFYRGDGRGHIIDEVLSHSQFISIGIIAVAILAYLRLKKKGVSNE